MNIWEWMLNVKKVYNFLNAYIGPVFMGLSYLCSILGVILLFVNNKLACIIALIVFCVGFIFIIYGIMKAINKMVLENSDKEYKSIATALVYQTTSPDGRKSTLETYRMIQCKRLFLTEIHFNFKWTGTKQPQLSSNAQIIENVHHDEDGNKWDDAIVKFTKPLRYNECTVINIKTENDDFDDTAQPWLSCKLSAPIEMLVFRILLSHKPDNYADPAVFERKKIDADIDGDYKYIERIEFDQKNKQYSFSKVNPEPGFIYRLKWEK